MKKLIIPLFLVLTLLCGCASAKKYEYCIWFSENGELSEIQIVAVKQP